MEAAEEDGVDCTEGVEEGADGLPAELWEDEETEAVVRIGFCEEALEESGEGRDTEGADVEAEGLAPVDN